MPGSTRARWSNQETRKAICHLKKPVGALGVLAVDIIVPAWLGFGDALTIFVVGQWIRILAWRGPEPASRLDHAKMKVEPDEQNEFKLQ
jgi:hypothetical protein